MDAVSANGMEFRMKEYLIDNVVKSFCRDGVVRTGCTAEETLGMVYRSLEGTARFNAITEVRHTVLVHSWYVGILAADMAPEGLEDMARLAGMMHDFGETIIGDFVKPIKSGEVFGDIYHRHYEPLERAFRSHVGNEVLGIADFDGKYASVEQYVSKADSVVGEMEFYGDAFGMDRNASDAVQALFGEMEESVTVGKFDGTLMELVGKVNSKEGTEKNGFPG